MGETGIMQKQKILLFLILNFLISNIIIADENIIITDEPIPEKITIEGCQSTSEIFMKECRELEIKQIFTTWSNPKGNADTERVMRTLKEDIVWTNDWDNPFEFEKALEKWINDYNTDLPHQSLNNLTPEQFRQKYEEQIYEPTLS